MLFLCHLIFMYAHAKIILIVNRSEEHTSELQTLFLIVPVLSLNIADGIMRFSLDETYDKREVFMVGVRRYIVACVLCILLVGVNQCFSIIETSLDKGTQRKTTENELPSLTQCTA